MMIQDTRRTTQGNPLTTEVLSGQRFVETVPKDKRQSTFATTFARRLRFSKETTVDKESKKTKVKRQKASGISGAVDLLLKNLCVSIC
jgi:hypothetical protein